MLISSDVNRMGRSQLEHPAVRKDQMLKVEHLLQDLKGGHFLPCFIGD